MKKNFVYLFILIIIASCKTGLEIKIDPERNYYDDAIQYYRKGIEDYKNALKSGIIAYYVQNLSQSQLETNLYIINESAEEVVCDLKRRIYTDGEEKIKKEIKEWNEKYNAGIEFLKIGYEYIIYYNKWAYYKLKEVNPNSQFIDRIEYKNLKRRTRVLVDIKYRYKSMLRQIKEYEKWFETHKKHRYAPSILLLLADLYLNLYENAPAVKVELGITDKQIQFFKKRAKELYRKIKKEYPRSPEALQLAYVIDNVRLRKRPATRSKVIKRIRAGTIVRILERSKRKVAISNMYDYWYRVKLLSGLEGWVYGFYLRTE